MDSFSSSPPSLNSLPFEIAELIAERLDLVDIQNVRLVSKDVERRFTGPSFLRHFESLTTHFSSQSMARLGAISGHPLFSSSVRRLVVLAVIYDTKDFEALVVKNGEITSPDFRISATFNTNSNSNANANPLSLLGDETWIQRKQEEQEEQCRSNFVTVVPRLAAILKQLPRLDSIQLESALSLGSHRPILRVNDKDLTMLKLSHRSLSPLASAVMSATVAALIKSEIKLTSFRLYSSNPATLEACAFTSLLTKFSPLAGAFGPIRDFALSFRLGIEPYPAVPFTVAASESPSLGHNATHHNLVFSHSDMFAAEWYGIPGLLGVMSELESLDLHMSTHVLAGGANVEARYQHKMIDTIVHGVRFPQLRQLTLRGLHVTESSLLQLLDNHPQLRNLELRYISLIGGDWAPIFSRLSKMPLLKMLHLSSLFSNRRLVNLAPENEEAFEREIPSWKHDDNLQKKISFPCSRAVLVFSREFGPESLRQGLVFTTEERGIHLPSPQLHSWISSIKLEFGDPRYTPRS